jgi:putative alpha-1,2-mannosidase
MSAWAVFSMMGFYPDCPGHPSYTLTTPRFDSVEISGGPVIRKKGDGLLIKSMALDGKRLSTYRISHDDLKGGVLTVYSR